MHLVHGKILSGKIKTAWYYSRNDVYHSVRGYKEHLGMDMMTQTIIIFTDRVAYNSSTDY